MTQVHYDDIGLGQVVDRSRWILTVRKAKPFKKTVAVPIHDDTARYKPYQRTFLRFVVTGTLLGPRGRDLAGKTIEAAPWNTDTDLHCYRLYEVEHIGKSPIYDRYETTADLDREKELILFLSLEAKDGFRFIAYESPAKTGDVLREIDRIRKDRHVIHPSEAGDDGAENAGPIRPPLPG